MIRHKLGNAGYPSPFDTGVIRVYEHMQNKRQDQEDKHNIRPNISEPEKEPGNQNHRFKWKTLLQAPKNY